MGNPRLCISGSPELSSWSPNHRTYPHMHSLSRFAMLCHQSALLLWGAFSAVVSLPLCFQVGGQTGQTFKKQSQILPCMDLWFNSFRRNLPRTQLFMSLGFRIAGGSHRPQAIKTRITLSDMLSLYPVCNLYNSLIVTNGSNGSSWQRLAACGLRYDLTDKLVERVPVGAQRQVLMVWPQILDWGSWWFSL